jgi:exodeoxyribonuclease V alpha subunit
MSSLAAALHDSLSRLIGSTEEPHTALALRQVVNALTAALERGELGLDLKGPAPESLHDPDAPADPRWPTAQLEALDSCGWLVESNALSARPQAPVVRDGRWLRWRLWHQQLQHCLAELISRGHQPLQPPPTAAERRAAVAEAAKAGLDARQCAAVEALLCHRLMLLSGGPGTGKTSTVVQMLAAVLRLQPNLRLQLAAPTGKAAGRLAAAVAQGARTLEAPLAERLRQLGSTTLHRLLEARADGTGFRRDPRRPLELDLLVVDEVSMVDLPLMAALLAALPPAARLLLVGDPGQLPPVGPGAVLLELSRPEALAALGPAAVELCTTYRNDGAIAAVAGRLRQLEASGPPLLEALLPQLAALEADANLQWLQAPADAPPAEALRRLRDHQQRLATLAQTLTPAGEGDDVAAHNRETLLAELERLILLSPIRQGRWGVNGLHAALLGDAAARPAQHWPIGTPVLNTCNLPEQGLANGDIGVLVPGRAAAERLVLFPGGRLLHPARLGPAEPALALTVHKAQGSQYQEVLLLLPPSRPCDARLLYTGLTRARRQAWLITPSGDHDPPAARPNHRRTP